MLTPHLGADTVEAQDKVGISIAQEVVNVLNGQMVPNAVNLPALHPQELEGMMGYLQLGECLGKLYYQMEKTRWTRWKWSTKGRPPTWKLP